MASQPTIAHLAPSPTAKPSKDILSQLAPLLQGRRQGGKVTPEEFLTKFLHLERQYNHLIEESTKVLMQTKELLSESTRQRLASCSHCGRAPSRWPPLPAQKSTPWPPRADSGAAAQPFMLSLSLHLE